MAYPVFFNGTASSILAAVLSAVLIRLLAFLIPFCLRLRHQSKVLSALPGPKYGFWGMQDEVFNRPDSHRASFKLSEKFGAIWHGRAMWMHIVHVSEPGLIAEVVQNKELTRVPMVSKMVDRLFDCGTGHQSVLTRPTDDYWRLIRKGFAPAFNTANLRAGFGKISELGSQLGDFLRTRRSGAVLNMTDLWMRESLDTIGHAGFGLDMGSVRSLGLGSASRELQIVNRALDEASKRMTGDPMRPMKFWLPEVHQGTRNIQAFHSLMRELLVKLKASPPPPRTILAHLLAVTEPATGKPLRDDQLLPELATIFFAGFETNGATGPWIMYYVSQHSEVEQKIAEELQGLDLLATPERPRPRPVTFEDVGKLTYLNKVIKEALRLKPVSSTASPYESERDLSLAGGKYIIPAGAWIVPFIAATHLNKDVWGEDAAEFKPERWEDAGCAFMPAGDSDKGSSRLRRYMPFMDGSKRDCLGMNLARLNLTATCAALYGSCRFTLAPEMGGPEDVAAKEVYKIVIGVEGGMKMCVHPRVPPA